MMYNTGNREQDVTGVIKNSDVKQIGEIKIFNVHIHSQSSVSSRKSNNIYLIYYDRKQHERKVSFKEKLLIYRKNKEWKIYAREWEEIDLNIMDASVSREKHAIFYIKNGDVYVEDLNSKNGVYVNGKRIKTEKLNEGDLIRIGSRLVFRLEYHPNKITTKEFMPLLVPHEIAKKLDQENIVKTDKGYYFIPTQSGRFEIDDKIIEIKESNKEDRLKNIELLLDEKTPADVIKQYLLSLLGEARDEKKEFLDKMIRYSQKNGFNEEILRLIEDILSQ